MGRSKRVLASLAGYYKILAVISLNCLILFLMVNLIASGLLDLKTYFAKEAAMNGAPFAYKKFHESLTSVHPGLTEEQVTLLIAETRKLSQAYEPYTQFKESVFSGKYVNVDPRGFRPVGNQGPWPPRRGEFTVFVFGGSTTFGYGVADDLTIPAQLQKQLVSDYGVSARVYNFGRGSYFCVQERLLLEKLLISGFVPDVAVFIDGLNDLVLLEPARTKDLRRFMEEAEVPLIRKIARELPVMKALAAMSPLPGVDETNLVKVFKATPPDQHTKMLRDVVDRYLSNKRITEAIAREFNVTPIFVWQPVPVYKYDRQNCVFGGFDCEGYFPSLRPGYEMMAKAVQTEALGPNFIWAADMQQNLKKPLYVDAVHYSGEMTNMIAKYILDEIRDRGLRAEIQAVIPTSKVGKSRHISPQS
jgi:lysophospholipase L1-like esterase